MFFWEDSCICPSLYFQIGSELYEGGVRDRLEELIWNETIEPIEFEEKWCSVLEQYKLEKHKWLCHMYNIRHRWIPAYFRHIRMSALMKTTSRSESENYFLGQNSNCHSSLVHFFSRFETAIEKQRYNQRLLDHETRMTIPRLETPLAIEKHAAMVYTREVFYWVQKEITSSLWTCTAKREDIVCDHGESTKGEFKVTLEKEAECVRCSCLQFERKGLLCRHIFYMFRHNNIERIPSKYIMRRWRKEAVKLPSSNQLLSSNTEVENILSEIYTSITLLVKTIGDDTGKLDEFLSMTKDFISTAQSLSDSKSSMSKKEAIGTLLSVPVPDEVEVQVPKAIRNKGCGSHKRYISAKEEAIKKLQKNKRLCRTCKELCNHDSRNCPKNVDL